MIQHDTTLTKVENEKAWSFVLIENGSEQLAADDPITFIAQKNIVLSKTILTHLTQIRRYSTQCQSIVKYL